MRKFESTGRVVLDKRTTLALKEKYSELRSEGTYYQFSYSKLASWIVNRYIEAYYFKERDLIKKAYFNPKGYMRTLLNECEDEKQLQVAMKDVLKLMAKSKQSPKKRTRKGSDDISIKNT